jgi:hypothetical protein
MTDPLVRFDQIAEARCSALLDVLIAAGASDALVTALYSPLNESTVASRALVASPSPVSVAAFDAIDSRRCNDMLTAIGANGGDVDLAAALYPACSAAQAFMRALIAEQVSQLPSRQMPPPLPPGYSEVYTDLFTTIDPARWSVYGPGNNERWGQGSPQFRTGFYSPAGVVPSPDGLVFEVKPDPQGRIATNGAPGWQTGFLQSKIVYPFFGRYEVRFRHDCVPGFWPAAEWATIASVPGQPGGSEVAEMDNHEWFGNDPHFFRQATHLRSNETGKVSYNVVQSLLHRSQRFDPPDPEGWHTAVREVRPDGGTHVRFTYAIDGMVTNDFSTRELAALGIPHDSWIPYAVGWPPKLCTQTNGQSGPWAPDAGNGPFFMHVAWFRVSQIA